MKNVFLKLFFIFAFILTLSQGVFAAAFNINSVIYDNSGSFLTINSLSNEDVDLDVKPQLYVDSENKKAYIDISPANLDCPLQNIVLTNSPISQITVSQQSHSEQVVRIAFSYLDGFNPKNVQLRKMNNTLFVKFKNPLLNNYYFQGVYLENKDENLFEPSVIETPVQVGGDSLLGQINSAFDIDSTKNYVLVKKNTLLRTKYYLDGISFKSGVPVIYGIGSYNLSRPFRLSNPDRIVFDLHNAVVNPSIRNKSISYGIDTIKIGQFDTNTVRIVITTQNPEKYIPVIFANTQNLAFIDKNGQQAGTFFNSHVSMNTPKYDKISSNIHSIKLFFTSPLIYGIERNNGKIELNLYNVENYRSDTIKRSLEKTPFENVQISSNNGFLKLSFPVENEDKIDIHIGADGKTLRLKETFHKAKHPSEVNMPEINTPELLPTHKGGRKYIVIDAGHGGSDCGALRGSINEKDITLDISKRVEKLLTKKGYVVTMTRTKDEAVSLQERVDISESIMPDIFVSIHVNSSNSETPSGLETHYYKDNSLDLAKCVHAAMLNNINSNNRGLFKSKFYVINHTTAPAILVEIGFLSNPKERSQLVTDGRKDATAKAIVEGIDEYFKQ